MKRKLAIAGAFLLMIVPAATVCASQPNTTTVHYRVDPVYEVVIPSNATVPFQVSESTYGKIKVETAVLDENKCILVTMHSENVLSNQDYPKAKISYQILAGGKPFTEQTYTKAGEETTLTISIDQKDWNRAPGGTYKTAITFTISYVDQE